MADTLANIALERDVWVDLYDETGISVGTQLSIQNLALTDILLVTKATEPTDSDGYRRLAAGEVFENLTNASGAWAKSLNENGLINVGEAV